MVKLEANNVRNKKKNNRLRKLKNVIEKLQKSLSLGREREGGDDCDYEDFDDVPEDVKEGHFAVIASQGEEPKRFVIPITYLTNPRFLRLLEEAAETYGFDHEGTLAIPCESSELEKILINN